MSEMSSVIDVTDRADFAAEAETPPPQPPAVPKKGVPKAARVSNLRGKGVEGPQTPFFELPALVQKRLAIFEENASKYLTAINGNVVLVPRGPLFGIWVYARAYTPGGDTTYGKWRRADMDWVHAGRVWSLKVQNYMPKKSAQGALHQNLIAATHMAVLPAAVPVDPFGLLPDKGEDNFQKKPSKFDLNRLGGLAYLLLREFYDEMDPEAVRRLRQAIWRTTKAAQKVGKFEPFLPDVWYTRQVIREVAGNHAESVLKWHPQLAAMLVQSMSPHALARLYALCRQDKVRVVSMVQAAFGWPKWRARRLLSVEDRLLAPADKRSVAHSQQNLGIAFDLQEERSLPADTQERNQVYAAIAAMGSYPKGAVAIHVIRDVIRMTHGQLHGHPATWAEWLAWHDQLVRMGQNGRRHLARRACPRNTTLSQEGLEIQTGWAWRQLQMGTEVIEEGEMMNHCVGGYAEGAMAGTTAIYRVTGPDGTPYTLAFPVQPGTRLEVTDFASRQNVNPPPAAWAWLRRTIAHRTIPPHWREIRVAPFGKPMPLVLWTPPTEPAGAPEKK